MLPMTTQRQPVTLATMEARPETLIIRLRSFVPMPVNQALTRDLQGQEVHARVQALIQDALNALPEHHPQRATLMGWRAQFARNPLQTERQRNQAAVDLEWLLYEQIESQAILRIAIDDRRVNAIAQVLLNTPVNVLALRAKYRAKARELLHQKITVHTLERYQAFIGDLFYEVGRAISTELAQERGTIVQEGRNSEAAAQEASVAIHAAAMRSGEVVMDLRATVANRYHLFQAVQDTHQASLQTLERIISGSKS